ncbi:MAG: ABC transporter permease [Ignavibacteria bacterium]
MNYTFNVAKREFRRIGSSKFYLFMLFLLPLSLFSFFAYVYETGVLREIPVAVCDYDNSELSRTYINFIESTGSMKILKYVQSEADIRNEFLDGSIYAAFVIPYNFEKNTKSGKPASVIVYNNTTNLITGNTVYKDALTFTKMFSGGVLLKKMRSKGIKEETALNILNAVKIDSRPLYNPNYNYLNYLIPGLVPVMLQMAIMLLTAVIISSEFSHGNFGNLLEAAGGSVWALLAGKAVPYLLINTATALLIPGLFYSFFKVDMPGSLTGAALLFILFSVSCVFFGILISTLSKNYMFTAEISLFLNTPAFIFSGFVYPFRAMPGPHVWFAQLMPFTHFIDAYLKIGVMNSPVKDALQEIIKLTAFVFISIAITLVILYLRKRQLLKPEARTQESAGEHV